MTEKERVPFSAWICGGSGKLTPEAQAELAAFGAHLRDHLPEARVAGCRFCAARRSASPTSGDTPR